MIANEKKPVCPSAPAHTHRAVAARAMANVAIGVRHIAGAIDREAAVAPNADKERAGIRPISSAHDGGANAADLSSKITNRIADTPAIDMEGAIIPVEKPDEDVGGVINRPTHSDFEGSIVDRRDAGVGVVGGEGERAIAVFGYRAGAVDTAGVGGVIRAVEAEGGVVCDVAGDGTARATIADREPAGGNGCAAGVGVVGGEGERAIAVFGYRAGAVDGIGENQIVGTVDRKIPVVEDVPSDRARRAAIAELQGAGGNGGAGGIGEASGKDKRAVVHIHLARVGAVGRGERGGARAELVEGAVGIAAGEVAREGVVTGEVEVQGCCAVAKLDKWRSERGGGVAAAEGTEV